MQAEYFAPNEDVILQKEKPTNLYIIVSGSVVSTYCKLRMWFLLHCVIGYSTSIQKIELIVSFLIAGDDNIFRRNRTSKTQRLCIK